MKCVFVVEQPSSSLLHRHPRFRALVSILRIFRISFWLSKFGAKSPKRLKLFSNSSGIGKFRTGKLSKQEREKLPHRLASYKIDPITGKKTYTGNKALLKESQTETQLLLVEAVMLTVCHDCMYILGHACSHCRSYPDGFSRKYVRVIKKLRKGLKPPRKLCKAIGGYRVVGTHLKTNSNHPLAGEWPRLWTGPDGHGGLRPLG